MDESPRKTQGSKALKTKPQNPQGLWRLKKARDTAITLQLVPVKMGEGTIAVEVPPTPGPSPPGPMQRWPTQDVSQIEKRVEEPPSTEADKEDPSSTPDGQEEKQE